ncbi:MAG: hypothetical protein A3A58_01085 [Candidatus Blackburnbacteria bacterium RIFCSPLOWO2_01_FULL_41_27]|uniref:Uncharacterized protein n=1 Tax=Candidatus Blackburnbacteria bacterium RIFCSPLOWO2_01_FULL_41_27 TaxID=1797520 RepID=A0A1G1VHJ9_9BACT|nr:MAG: hypothetical protein A3A58_01085 [Candidatus Blackburnbacteria bacterium RIFCSPLOWO2_01_FULL_41_27]
MSETQDQSSRPTIQEDLLSLRTSVEKLRAFKILTGQPTGHMSELLKDINKQGDKLAKSEKLVTEEEQGVFIYQVGKVRDLVFEHGINVFEDEDGDDCYKVIRFGVFNVYADLEESVSNTFLSFTAKDAENRSFTDLTVNEDMKTYEFEVSFSNTGGRRDVRYNSGETPLEMMTDVEYRILMHYMERFLKEFQTPILQ